MLMLADSELEMGVGELRHPDNFKWTKYPGDVLPLWVADMDFRVAASIRKALRPGGGGGVFLVGGGGGVVWGGGGVDEFWRGCFDDDADLSAVFVGDWGSG